MRSIWLQNARIQRDSSPIPPSANPYRLDNVTKLLCNSTLSSFILFYYLLLLTEQSCFFYPDRFALSLKFILQRNFITIYIYFLYQISSKFVIANNVLMRNRISNKVLAIVLHFIAMLIINYQSQLTTSLIILHDYI